MARIAFRNTWTGHADSWDPEKGGYWFLVWKPGIKPREDCVIDPSTGQFLGLSCGDISAPHYSLEEAERAFALMLMLYPVASGKLQIVKAPCVFCTRDGHVFVSDTPRADLNAEISELMEKYPWRFMSDIGRKEVNSGEVSDYVRQQGRYRPRVA